MATGELPTQCSDQYPHLCGELVTGKLTPPTPADHTNSENVQEETDQSGPSELVLPRPLYRKQITQINTTQVHTHYHWYDKLQLLCDLYTVSIIHSVVAAVRIIFVYSKQVHVWLWKETSIVHADFISSLYIVLLLSVVTLCTVRYCTFLVILFVATIEVTLVFTCEVILGYSLGNTERNREVVEDKMFDTLSHHLNTLQASELSREREREREKEREREMPFPFQGIWRTEGCLHNYLFPKGGEFETTPLKPWA